ncbi:alpha-1,6-glucosidase domain-containing protein [Simiduia aestuariiviva]|uniref:pullulanase n=1 Tax=Simiduia aestuariiviva TaxID=1510459 RepID=A0A839UHG2_9GAMM|nr:alpha-1,6-glucosidase domain-containing protein [Simiduia aestuariiviva]MBB3167302.1 pullulanase [Simiduia aestuariiviva]
MSGYPRTTGFMALAVLLLCALPLGNSYAQSAFSGPDPEYFPADDEAVIYFNRQHMDQSYSDWVLHLWNEGCAGGWAAQVTDDATAPTNWPEGPGINGAGVDPIYGAYWVLRVQPESSCGNWIIHNRAADNQSNDQRIDLAAQGKFARMAFVIANANMRSARVSEGAPICVNDVCEPAAPAARVIRDAAAHWVDAETLVWNVASGDALFAAPQGGMAVDDAGDIQGAALSASLQPTTLTVEQAARIPHLANWAAFSVSGLTREQIRTATQGQLWVTGTDAQGNLVGTAVQTARLLDALYTAQENDADEAALGITYDRKTIAVSVWAPTAHNVTLEVFKRNHKLWQTVPMDFDSATGIWTARGKKAHWNNRYYRFVVDIYDAANDLVRAVETTDPYSVNVSANGTLSHFVDLDDRRTQPAGWGSVAAPALVAPEQAVIYEGHVRDFSIRDESTRKPLRGKYLAFADRNSYPVRHLRELQAAGLTHFHALPTADFATTNELARARVELNDTVKKLCYAEPSAPVCGVESDSATLLAVLESYDPTTDAGRDLVNAMRQLDGFNWGYDPFHYNVPEGSYASRATGVHRIKELRAMNQALHGMGLRVVMDVVYNHTSSSGFDAASSTFDKLVPGYYFRRDPITGNTENASGAGSDTAGENRMFGKFIKDSVVHWAKHYGYDDFRFDLMTFIPKSVIEETRAAVQAFKPDSYFYGEGWNMPGSSANDAIFERAEQFNMAGSGVGTYNDRMRDPMRYLALVKGENVDRIRAGLAGNLADFSFYNSASERVTADTVGAYGKDPQDTVNYVSKHDNETLWDMIQKEGAVDVAMSAADRARIQNLTLAMPLLAQGVPFLHMGSDLLRSKSMDRNTYDAGDWYNYVDFTQRTNNWAVAMPIDRGDASEDWIRAQFNNPNTYADSADIQLSAAVFKEFLRIAQASPLFSLTDLASVQARVGFHNTGRTQVPGMIAMSIDDGLGVPDLDPNLDAVMVVFNGNASTASVRVRTAEGFELHALQAASSDTAVRAANFANEWVLEDVDGVATEVSYGTFTVPAYSAAVFVKVQRGAQGPGMDANATIAGGGPVDKPYGATPLLRGDMNGWGTSLPFMYNGDGSYTAFVTLDAGVGYNFKVASSDWSTVNFGATSDAERAVVLGEVEPMAGTNDNLFFTAPSTGEYRFTVDASNASAPLLTVTLAAPYANTVYLKGSMNGWSDVLAVPYVGQGIYQVPMYLAAGSYQFKLADASWSAPNLGLQTGGDVIGVNGSVTLADGSNDNINVTLANSGDYVFTLDTRDAVNPQLHLVQANRLPSPMYLKGSMNGWSNVDALTELGDNRYQIAVPLSAGGYEFKIANDNWSVEFTADGSVQLLQPRALVPGAGKGNSTLQLQGGGTVMFTLDANFAEPLLTVRVQD